MVLIAATLVLFSLLTSFLARRSPIVDDSLASGAAWLIGANIAFLTGATSLLFIPVIPLQYVSLVTMGGAYAGLLFGYFAIHRGAGGTPYHKAFATIGALSVAFQWIMIINFSGVAHLLVISSIINAAVTLSMGVVILRSTRAYGRELGVLVSVPFFAISAGFILRLILIALDAPQTAIVTVTTLNAFIFAFSALQWSFGLLALRAARLNQSLDAERRRAQNLARTRGQFLAHMSHEIRTPLNSVLGLVDVLKSMVKQDDEREILEHVRSSGDLLVHILNDILDISKLEANAVKIEKHPFDVSALLHQIEASYAPKCRSRAVDLEINIEPEAVGIWQGDPHRVCQILHNVVGNAVKFTENGSVRVSIRGAEKLELRVEDTGIGMTAAQTASMFDEFSQADEGITRRFGGTGLGMAIVRRLVILMDGEISVESELAKGTRFTISLPLQRINAIDSIPKKETLPTTDFAALRVLCADDSVANLLVIRKMLGLLGIHPQTVEDGCAAIHAVEQNEFDVYFLDISMPGFSGIETLHRIRKIERDSRRAPAYAVASTANVMATDVDSYLSAGFDNHLSKPIRIEALKSALLQITNRKGFSS